MEAMDKMQKIWNIQPEGIIVKYYTGMIKN